MKRSVVAGLTAFAAAIALSVDPSASLASQATPSVVIRVEQVGGFVGPNVLVARLPEVLVYSDGRILTQKESYGPVTEMFEGKLSASALRNELTVMSRAVQVPSGGWGLPGVADIPSTQIFVLQNGKKRVADVFALGFTTGNLSKSALAARSYLSSAITKLKALAGKSHIYSPTGYEVWPLWPSSGQSPTGVDLANPAAVFCLSQNGTLVTGKVALDSPTPTPDQATEYCRLADGSYLEEWKYFYQGSRTGIVWPSQITPPTARCQVVTAKPFSALLAKAANKQWLLPSGALISLTWRPILPGEVGCKR